MELNVKTKIPFHQFLLQTKSITVDIIKQFHLQDKDNNATINLLTTNEILPKNIIEKLFKSYCNTTFSFFGHSDFNPEDSKTLPQNIAKESNSVLLETLRDKCIVGISNPLDFHSIKIIENTLKKKCEIFCIPENEVSKFHSKIYTNINQILTLVETIEKKMNVDNLVQKSASATTNKEAFVADLITLLVRDASDQNCSDIHIEEIDNLLSIKYRQNGQLQLVTSLNNKLSQFIFRTLKILANLDTTEEFHSLDGRFSVNNQEENINIRLSIMPLINGKSAVLRILGKEDNYKSMDSIIQDDNIISVINNYLQQDSGLFIVVGPTGSGKTTTLYNALLNLDSLRKKIVTIEDPVEIILSNINQIQVKPEFNFDFSDVLRSVLRQDPDVVLIGEIRDSTTAQMAMRAAITGHMVLATIHADNVETCIPRLLDLGVDEFYLESALKLIISQRLLRKVCDYCHTEDDQYQEKINNLNPYLSNKIKLNQKDIRFKKAVGCSVCDHTGYLGRFPVFEYFDLSNVNIPTTEKNISSMIKTTIKQSLYDNSLLDNAIKHAISGITTLDEVYRIRDKKKGPL